MVFGDGDGEVFTGFTGSLTVIAHELAHGVIEDEGGLEYQGQSGASTSRSPTSSARSPSSTTSARPPTRRLAHRRGHLHRRGRRAPRCARSPRPAPRTTTTCSAGTRSRRTCATSSQTADDNGGVHINSGIPNHAFYLVATALGGSAWERAGLIWYRTLTSGTLSSTADFAPSPSHPGSGRGGVR